MPGRLIGRTNGCWVFEWRWIPSAYIVALDLDAPKPLKMRVDPANTGLPRGLALVATEDQVPAGERPLPPSLRPWRGNRLNGVVMELGTGGTYSIPSGYS